MKKYMPVLGNCPLFAHIAAADLPGLMNCMGATEKAYSKKETILAEGAAAHSIGILLSGSAQIVQIDYYGNRSILGTLAPGDLFAETIACAGVKEIPVNVIASENCTVVFISCERVLHSCSSACSFHRQLLSNLMSILANKNIQFHQKIEIASKRTTREKLMTYLMQQAKRCGSSSFDIPFTRQELADYLQVDRSGLSVQISQLQKEGLIETSRKHFRLL